MSNLALATACAAFFLGGGASVKQTDAYLLPTTTTLRTYLRRAASLRRKSDARRDYVGDNGGSESSAKRAWLLSSSSSATSFVNESRLAQPPKDDAMMMTAQEVINTFTPGAFRPHPIFANSHVQTIVGGLFRKSTMYWDDARDNVFTVLEKMIGAEKNKNGEDDDDSFITWDERERVVTPDGDFFDIDWKYSPVGRPCKGTVVLTHGLESSSDKPLPRDLATAYHLQGFDVAYINFRGCSGEPNLTPAGYHLSFTDDLKYFLNLKKTVMEGPIFLSGFSLGANVVINFLAEVGQAVVDDYNVYGAAVNSCPLQVTRISPNLNGPENFFSFNVYGKDLLKKLADKSRSQALDPSIDAPFSVDDIDRCETIRDLENSAICSVYGFRDAEDYYEQSSVAGKLDRVFVPLYVLNSQDDPFLIGDARPSPSFARTTKFLFTDHGGHCGNVLHTGSTSPGKVGDDGRLLQSSWMPGELARFIDHVANSSAPS